MPLTPSRWLLYLWSICFPNTILKLYMMRVTVLVKLIKAKGSAPTVMRHALAFIGLSADNFLTVIVVIDAFLPYLILASTVRSLFCISAQMLK